MPVALVFAGGRPRSRAEDVRARLEHLDVATVVAADSGYDDARRIGFDVDVLIGDMDSISEQGLSEARDLGVEVVELPEDKDRTDLEAAMGHAAALPISEIVVVASLGGRVDHALGAVAVLGGRWGVRVSAIIDEGIAWVVRDEILLDLGVGTTVSLLAIGSDAAGVRTEGLRFPLDGETLHWNRARGISNVVSESPCTITVDDGTLLVVSDTTDD